MGNSKLGKLLKGNNEVFYSLSFIVLIEIDQFIIKISKLNLDLKWYMYSEIFFFLIFPHILVLRQENLLKEQQNVTFFILCNPFKVLVPSTSKVQNNNL